MSSYVFAAAAAVAATSASAQPVLGLLTFGYTDLQASVFDDGMTLGDAQSPAFETAGDVTFSAGQVAPNGTDLILTDSVTAGFEAGTLGAPAGFAFTMADGGPSGDQGPAEIRLTDVDGDQIVIALAFANAGFFSDEFLVTDVSFEAGGTDDNNDTFDGADGNSFVATGLELADLGQGSFGAVTILPSLSAPESTPFLVQGLLIVQIPAPGSTAMAGIGGLLLLGGRRRGLRKA